jgi:hypothetical protein
MLSESLYYKKDAGYTQNVRLRSANRGNSYNTWNVNTSGNANNNNANNSYRCAPDCESEGTYGCSTGAVLPSVNHHKESVSRHYDEQHYNDAASPAGLLPLCTLWNLSMSVDMENIIGFDAVDES